MRRVVDALGREVHVPAPPRRIVSLVPSETESVADLVGLERLVGRTRYCIEPAGAIEAVPVVGGTKKLDVRAVLDLSPDLVLANQEENGRADVQALIDAGLVVHVSFPRGVAEAVEYLRTLARLLHAPADAEPLRRVEHAYAEAQQGLQRDGFRVRVFVPIWKEPLMTFDGRTFASDLLDLCGAENVFADRPRRYPLAADLGRAPELPPERLGDRDTRYPRVPLEEVRSRRPHVVLLPDEPYEFTPADAPLFASLGVPLHFINGKDIFWYGTRLGGAIARVRNLVASLRRP